VEQGLHTALLVLVLAVLLLEGLLLLGLLGGGLSPEPQQGIAVAGTGCKSERGNGSVSENRSRNENGGSEVVAVAKPEEFLRECGLGRVHVAMAWHFLLQKHRYGWIRPGL